MIIHALDKTKIYRRKGDNTMESASLFIFIIAFVSVSLTIFILVNYIYIGSSYLIRNYMRKQGYELVLGSNCNTYYLKGNTAIDIEKLYKMSYISVKRSFK